MTVYVLTENEKHEGGVPVGVYSTPEKARDAAAERPLSPEGFFYYEIYPIDVDAPPKQDRDSFGPGR